MGKSVDIVAGAATHRIKRVDLRVQRKKPRRCLAGTTHRIRATSRPRKLVAVRRARSTTAAYAGSQVQQTMQTPNRGKTRTPRASADLWSEPLYLSVAATFLNGTPE